MSKSIKAYHLTKLRVLRDELQAKATEAKRKQRIADRAIGEPHLRFGDVVAFREIRDTCLSGREDALAKLFVRRKTGVVAPTCLGRSIRVVVATVMVEAQSRNFG